MFKKLVKSLLLVSLLNISVYANAQEKLYIYNWTSYLPQELIEKFTKQTGIDVIYSTYESNEVMYAKLKLMQKDSYDLIFPSNYYVEKMRKEGMLHELDKNQIPNMKYLTPGVLDKAYDPGNKYSIPYVYGVTGIGFNSDKIDASEIDSWQAFWDPKYKGELLLHDDAREIFSIALLLKNYNANSTNKQEIAEAFELLKTLMPNVQTFNSDLPEAPFVQEEVSIGTLWNGAFIRGEQNAPNLKFSYPKEGALLWIDCYAIPRNAKNAAAAHKFINFLLEPENSKLILEGTGYSTPNEGMKKLVAPEIMQNKVLFPPEEELNRAVLQEDIGEAIDTYEYYWQKLRVDYQ